MDEAARRGELMDRILGIVRGQLGRTGVGVHDRFLEDLGAESFDILNIVAAVEDRLGIYLEEEEIPSVRSPADLHDRALEKLESNKATD